MYIVYMYNLIGDHENVDWATAPHDCNVSIWMVPGTIDETQ